MFCFGLKESFDVESPEKVAVGRSFNTNLRRLFLYFRREREMDPGKPKRRDGLPNIVVKKRPILDFYGKGELGLLTIGKELEFRKGSVVGSACTQYGVFDDDSVDLYILLIECLEGDGTFDKEFSDMEQFSGLPEGVRNGKFDVFDGNSPIVDDLSGADLDVEIGIAFLEFADDMFLDFVIELGIDVESSGGSTEDGEQCDPAEGCPESAQKSHAEL